MAYRRRFREADPERFRRYERASYRRRMATPAGKDRMRDKWKADRERLKRRSPNHALREARLRAGLSQYELAESLGVSRSAVQKWERFSVTPRSVEIRKRATGLLGIDPWS